MRHATLAHLIVAAALVGIPVGATAQEPATQYDGKPSFEAGKALGYFLWRDGETWKLRWMTFGAAHSFSGRVVVEGGAIESFKRIDIDTERQVIRPGHRTTTVRGPRGRPVAVRPGRAPVVAVKTLDKIEQQSETIVQWLTNTDDDLDGIDFKVTASATVLRFNLMIDDEARPKEVEGGKGNFKPGVNPVVVRLRP